jgi:hypothetical protein
MGREYGKYGGEEKYMQIFCQKPKGRPRHGWEDIKLELIETGWHVWTGFIWLRIG